MAKNGSLFFALEAYAAWPEHFPKGRILEEASRHLTLAFLGDASLEKALSVAKQLSYPYSVAPFGVVDEVLFLPKRHSRCASYHVELISDDKPLQAFYRNLMETLQKETLSPSHPERPLLNHITIARHPEELEKWRKDFTPFPLILKDLHLYESCGYSKYKSHFRLSTPSPFEEISHTADIAFHIRGKTHRELYLNAFCALAFEFPPMLTQPLTETPFEDLSGVIIALNELVTMADAEVGCPFKAVSFHGEVLEQESLLHWEMIVDV